MKYYLIEISEGDSTIAGKAVYEYDVYKTALATFYQKLATAMKSDLYTSELIILINSEGSISKMEKYMAASQSTES